MIIANITTYIGMDAEAEHYYCSYDEIENSDKFIPMPYFKKDTQLHRILTSNVEVLKLNKKGGYSWMKLGDETNRFNSIEEIQNELIKKYPDSDIVTYYESEPFKDMLFIKDGVNLGYKALGDIWVNVPNMCWKDLLPEDEWTNVNIKCENCGQKHYLADLIEGEHHYSIENRTAIKFNIKKRDMLDPCCNYPDLVWNVIL